MKAGEYIGADGRIYQWKQIDGMWRLLTRVDGAFVSSAKGLATADWPAAKAALDALVEAESGLEEKRRREHYEAVVDEALRDACLQLRNEASKEGTVCGPCSECRLEPYFGKGCEAEAGEWVTWRSGEFDYRAKPDGSIVEWAVKERCDWTSWGCPEIADAYRKGREVALEECKRSSTVVDMADYIALQDAVRELVEAVIALGASRGDLAERQLWVERVDRMVNLAKKVTL